MSSVKLVAVSQPTIDGLTNAESLVAFCARVSNPTNQMNELTAQKLVQYLIKHKHWSPFEMVSVTVEIETTRDIARQILRHRSFSFQEFSQRYADPTGDLGFSHREARLQDKKNRQNSIELSQDDRKIAERWEQEQKFLLDSVKRSYDWAIKNGIAKEQARAVLPEGLTNSRLYMAGTLRSWIHYCQLRCGLETQKEHREVAQDCWDILTKEFPSIIGVL
jgi:thymidylate synthase (FAD)